MKTSPRIKILSALSAAVFLAALTCNHDHWNPADGIRSASVQSRSDTTAHIPAVDNPEETRFPEDLTTPTTAPGEAPRTKRSIRPQPSLLSAGNDGISITRNIPSARKKPWHPAPQEISAIPASFIEITPTVPMPDGAEEFLRQLAQEFKAKMEDSGLSPEEPAYKALWESEAFLNNIRFQTTYGDTLWLQHHNALQEAGSLQTAK